MRNGVEGFVEFTGKHPVFFAKRLESFGGLGVKKFSIQGRDTRELYDDLVSGGYILVEEAIVQHADMASLCSSSVNTIRMVTVLKDGETHFMYSLVRMGSGDSDVDNISSGGMYCPIDAEGRLSAPAFCDKTGLYYDKHPLSGTVFAGFEIPMYDSAVSIVKEAAHRVPEVRYVGWDVAITEKGPIFVEGNTFPGYDMCQNYGHLSGDKQGIKPRFREVLADEFPL